MFPKLDEELHFGFQRNGSLVIARGVEEEEVLNDLMKRGAINGVKNLRILNREEVLEREPYVASDVTAALYSPDAGNMIPYEYAIALAENAVDNGVELRIRSHHIIIIILLFYSHHFHYYILTFIDEKSLKLKKQLMDILMLLLNIGNQSPISTQWKNNVKNEKKNFVLLHLFYLLLWLDLQLVPSSLKLFFQKIL